MFSRIFLFLSKNIRMVVGSFMIMLIIMVVMNVSFYLIASLDELSSNDDYAMINVVSKPDYGMIDGGNVSSTDTQGVDYNNLYDTSKEIGGVLSYRVDPSDNLYIISAKDNAVATFLPIIDEKHKDFVSGNAHMVSGELLGRGLIISEKYAQYYNLSVGQEIEFSSAFLMEVEFNSSSETPEFEYSYTVKIPIVGVYSSNDYGSIFPNNMGPGEDTNSAPMHPMYIAADVLQETYTTLKNESIKNVGDETEYIKEVYKYDTPQFMRFFAEFDTKEQGKKFMESAGQLCSECEVIDSSNDLENASKPVLQLRISIIVFTVFVLISSLIALYLNYYLLLEKRKDEIISLVSFGLSKNSLRIQGFIEIALLAIVALPFSYAVFKYSIDPIVELIQKYYFIIVDRAVNEGTDSLGYLEIPYLSVRVEEVVKFANPNVAMVILISFGITLLLVLLSTLFEMTRRIKMYVKD